MHRSSGYNVAFTLTAPSPPPVLFYDLRMSLSAAPAASAFAHQGPVRSIACNPKGDLIATTGEHAVMLVTPYRQALYALSDSPPTDQPQPSLHPGYFGHPPHRLPDRRVCLLDARRGYTEAAPAMHPMGASWAAFVPLRTATGEQRWGAHVCEG